MTIRWDNQIDFSKIRLSEETLSAAATKGLDPVKETADELVPKDTHHLVGTSHITPGNPAELGFDGPYAAYIHEHMEFHHPHGGVAKFEELAFAQRKDDALQAAADVIREAMS